MSRLLRHLIYISCIIIHFCNCELCIDAKQRKKLRDFDATRKNYIFVTNVSCTINYFDVSFVNRETLNVIHSSENLRTLDLSHNHISEIDTETFLEFGSLDTLRLNDNFMTKVKDDIFKNLIELTGLDLSHNLIDVISVNAFKYLQNLLWLNIDDNCLYDVTLYLPVPALHSLSIAYNRINRFPQLSGIRAITNLDLSNNLIADLKLRKNFIKSIQKLNMGGNYLKDSSRLIAFSSLSELNLADNGNIDYETNEKFIRHLAALRKLNLTNTNLISFDIFRHVSGENFIELFLSQNPLQTNFEELSKFSNLERLEFQQKSCYVFDSYRSIRRKFKNLKSVKILYDDSENCKCIEWNRMQFKFEDIEFQSDFGNCENDPDCCKSIKLNFILIFINFFVINKVF